MIRLLILLVALVLTFSCSSSESSSGAASDRISAVDISSFPEISTYNPTFKKQDGTPAPFLQIIKESGVNTVRLRLWVNPANGHSGYDEVKAFSEELKALGFKVWLSLHYSDTWADPAQQSTPQAWINLNFNQLKTEVYNYTKMVVTGINPDYVQIGNEINSGLLHPVGALANTENMVALLDAASKSVRDHAPNCKIMIHYAGIDGAQWFFNQVAGVDYDLIALSYYPIWHGKSLQTLQETIGVLAQSQDKKVVLAETAYPFTLDWNDWTNNIVGLNEQLILPDFPATPDGQKDFVSAIKSITDTTPGAMGFCYWGGELIAWKGTQATDASPWENQALFDFDLKALPVLDAFR